MASARMNPMHHEFFELAVEHAARAHELGNALKARNGGDSSHDWRADELRISLRRARVVSVVFAGLALEAASFESLSVVIGNLQRTGPDDPVGDELAERVFGKLTPKQRWVSLGLMCPSLGLRPDSVGLGWVDEVRKMRNELAHWKSEDGFVWMEAMKRGERPNARKRKDISEDTALKAMYAVDWYFAQSGAQELGSVPWTPFGIVGWTRSHPLPASVQRVFDRANQAMRREESRLGDARLPPE